MSIMRNVCLFYGRNMSAYVPQGSWRRRGNVFKAVRAKLLADKHFVGATNEFFLPIVRATTSNVTAPIDHRRGDIGNEIL